MRSSRDSKYQSSWDTLVIDCGAQNTDTCLLLSLCQDAVSFQPHKPCLPIRRADPQAVLQPFSSSSSQTAPSWLWHWCWLSLMYGRALATSLQAHPDFHFLDMLLRCSTHVCNQPWGSWQKPFITPSNKRRQAPGSAAKHASSPCFQLPDRHHEKYDVRYKSLPLLDF